MTSRPKAYSYTRFSTPEQAKGDSLRRQTQAAEEYARQNDLELDAALNFHDAGVSAFGGDNASTGRLRDFLTAVERGLVAPGSFLLVESLDRISRETARRALRTLEEIADAGVTVVTLNDRRQYTRRSLDDDPMSLMLAILTFIRANEESVTKAGRLRRAWEAKRSAAGKKPLTARCPAWLKMRPDRSGFEAIPERAEVVQEVFRMAAEGIGQHAIAAELNRRGRPTWGDAGRRPASYWQRSYIAKLLNSPAAMGTLVPRVHQRLDGRKVSRALDPVPGYYPAVVDEVTFEAARARRGRRTGRGSSGAVGGHLKHLLAGLARCPLCSGTMTRVEKGPRGGRAYLVCSRAKVGAGCEYKSVPVATVDAAVLQGAATLLASVPTAVHVSELSSETNRLFTDSWGLELQIEQAVEAIVRNPDSPALKRHLADLEARHAATEDRLTALEAAHITANPRFVAIRLKAAADALTAVAACGTGETLTAANARLHELLAGVVVDHVRRELRFDFRHGACVSVPVPEMLQPVPRRRRGPPTKAPDASPQHPQE